MPRYFALRFVLLFLAWLPVSALAFMSPHEPPLQPFSASYHLEVKGWPNANIEHRLTRESGHWQSQMQAAIAVARGNERSRFIVTPEGVQAVNYSSGYSLLGLGGDYRLGSHDLALLPDRQAALVQLSRQALSGDCQNVACQMTYLDHRGREESLEYRLLGTQQLTLPAGNFDAIKVEAHEPDKPDRRLLFYFHPETPGLLLAVDYHRDGERQSRLTLTSLDKKQ